MSVITDAAAKAGGGDPSSSDSSATNADSDRSDSDPFRNDFQTTEIPLELETISMVANTLVAAITLREVVK